MKKLRYSLWLSVSALFLFNFANFVFSQTASQSFHVRPWAVGQSATYQTQTFKDGQLIHTETVTYSIVGSESIKGKNYLWFETERDEQNGVTLIQKILVREPKAIDFENFLERGLAGLRPRRKIQKIILPSFGPVKHSSLNEFEIPADSVSQIENGPDPSWAQDLTSKYPVLPNQPIHTSAGNFKSFEVHSSFPVAEQTPSSIPSLMNQNASDNKKAWGSAEIPILGLVKQSREGKSEKGDFLQETELISFRETGAVTKITEKPRLVTQEEQSVLKQNISNENPTPSGSLQGQR